MDKDELLEKALKDLEDIEPDFENAVLTAAEAEADYEIAWSRAYLEANGTIDSRKAEATVQTAKYLKARNDAKAVKEFLRAKLKDRQDTVSARQSLLRADVLTNRAVG